LKPGATKRIHVFVGYHGLIRCQRALCNRETCYYPVEEDRDFLSGSAGGDSLQAPSLWKALPVRLIIAWTLALIFVFAAYILSGLETMIMALAIVAVAAIILDRFGLLGRKGRPG